MRDQETYSDLTDLFTAEDRALDPAPFVNDVMGGIRRKSLFRWCWALSVWWVLAWRPCSYRAC